MKNFVLETSERGSFETMPIENVKNYLKDDGFDYLREKVYHNNILESEFRANLADVEKTIDKLKRKNEPISIKTTYFKEVLEDRVIIIPDEAEAMTDGGLYVVNENVPARGTIIKVGPGMPSKMHHKVSGFIINGVFKETLEENEKGDPLYTLLTMPLKEGDRVIYSKQAGLKVNDPTTKKDFLVMRISDVWITI